MNRRHRPATLAPAAAPRGAPEKSGASALAASSSGPEAAAPGNSWIGLKAAALLIVAAVALAYVDSLPNDYVFDDKHDIFRNPGIVRPWPPWAAAIGWRNGHLALHPRPVVVTTFAWNFALGGGDRPWVFRLTNILIHALAALTLFGLVRRSLLLPRCAQFASAATGLALVVAMLWAVHPLTTQAVSYITQRYESLMGLFYLLTLYCALRGFTSAGHGAGWKAASVVASGLGMGSKEVAVTAPLMVLLFDWMLVSGDFRRALAQNWKMYAGFAAMWLIFAPLYRIASGGSFAGFAIPIPWWRYALSEAGVILHYLQLSVLPAGQCFDYCWPLARSFADVAPSVVGIALLLVATIWGLARRNTAALLGAAFFLVLSVTSSVMPISDLAVEHRMYLPLAPIVALVVIGGYWLALRARGRYPQETRRLFQILPVLAIAAICLMGAQTALRNRVYESSLTLWQDAVDKQPRNPRALYSLALAIHDLGSGDSPEYDRQALPILEQSLAFSPLDPDARGLRGIMLENLGRKEEAEKDYREAVKIGHDHPESWYNLANLLSRRGQALEAVPLYDEALRIDDQCANGYGNRAANSLRLQRLPEAQRDLERAIQLDGSHSQWYFMLTTALALQGKNDEAIRFALHDYPPQYRDADYYILLGAVYAKQEKFTEAEAAYRQAMQVNPKHQAAKLGLADMFSNLGRTDEAIAILRPMLQADPDDASVLLGLGGALAKAGQTTEAAEKYREALRLKPDLERARKGLADLGLQP